LLFVEMMGLVNVLLFLLLCLTDGWIELGLVRVREVCVVVVRGVFIFLCVFRMVLGVCFCMFL